MSLLVKNPKRVIDQGQAETMKNCRRVLFTVSACLMACCPTIVRADIAYNDARFPPSETSRMAHATDDAHLRIYGTITKRDRDDLKPLLDKVITNTQWISMGGSKSPLVVLDSPGGDMSAAMEIGEVLRAKGAITWVLPGTSCSSACVFILASGVTRVVSPNARIGLHRPVYQPEWYGNLSKEKAEDAYHTVVTRCRQYLMRMGIPGRVFELMLAVPSDSVSYYGSAQARTLGLDGTDPAYEEWDKARERLSK